MSDFVFLIFWSGMLVCLAGVIVTDLMIAAKRLNKRRERRHVQPILFR